MYNIEGNNAECSFCKDRLNGAPIYAYKNSYVCNNCDLNKCTGENKELYARQYLYENINKKNDAIETHTCKTDYTFKRLYCPFRDYMQDMRYEICNWEGYGQDLDAHMEQWHNEEISLSPVWFSICESEMTLFTYVNGYLFFIFIMYRDKERYDVCVFSTAKDEERDLFRWQFEIFDDEGIPRLIVRKEKIFSYYNFNDHLANRDDMFPIYVSSLKPLKRQYKGITGVITISNKSNRVMKAISSQHPSEPVPKCKLRDKTSPLRDDLLEELRCPICMRYMSPPIFICASGHSICSDCNSRLNRCPSCQAKLKGTRNFTLESLTTQIKYSCPNHCQGCYTISTSDKLPLHIKSCYLSGKTCIFKCSWKGNFQGMKLHVQERHKDYIFSSGKTYHLETNLPTRNSYLVIFTEEEVFRLAIRNDLSGQGLLKCNVQRLGFQPLMQHKYELEIINKSNSNMRCTMSSLCEEVTKEARDALNSALIITKDTLNPFIKRNSVCYKIRIHKIE